MKQAFPLAFGDELAIGDVTFKLYQKEFGVEGLSSTYLVPLAFALRLHKGLSSTTGSPRIIYRSSEDKILIQSSGSEQKPSGMNS